MEAVAQSKMMPQRVAIKRLPKQSGFRTHAVLQQEVRTVEPKTTAQDIYIGKGRFVKDDPRKYPRKEDLGVFAGATGGWAGGEAALWQFREEIQASKQGAKSATSATKVSVPRVSEKGKAAIYLGKSKAGGAPRYVVDDPRKYPGREDVAFIPGATGGFAGGEKGLKMFVESGEVLLRDANSAGPYEYSPLTFSFVLVAAGSQGLGGGLLLNSVLEAGKEAVVEEVVAAPIDDSTKSLLLLALGLLGTAAAVGGARAALNSVRERLREGAEKLVVTAAYWVGTLLLTAIVLQN